MFFILCLCIILCDTSKALENLTFVLKSHFVECFCCPRDIKIKDFVEQMTIDLFQNCDVPEGESVIFDPEVVSLK